MWQHHLFSSHNISSNFVFEVITGAKAVVRTVYSNSNGFDVKDGMHEDSALSIIIDFDLLLLTERPL